MQIENENAENKSGLSHLDKEKIQKAVMKNSIKGLSKKQKLLGLLVIILLLITGGYGLYSHLRSSNDGGYLTMSVAKSTITDAIEATGTLSSIKESAMGFKNDETITALNVQPGDHVKKGQILAQQDATTLNSAVQQAIRTVEQDQISIKTANLNYKNNLKTLEQQQRLFEAGVISETELETAKDNVSKSEWEIAAAQSKLLNDQTKVEQAQSDLDGATLAAPFDGLIGAVNGQVRQINGINSNSSTLLTVMSEDLQLSALVNEADIGKIKVGQDVEFTSSSYSDLVFKGKVLRITPQAQTVSNVQYYPVLISCIDPEHKLFSGMSVSANIIIARQTDVLTVPMMAVSYAQTYLKNNPVNNNQNKPQISGTRTKPDASKASSDQAAKNAQASGKPGMVVVLQNNQPVVKTVVLGLSDGSKYEVIKGLEDGNQVIVGSSQAESTAKAPTSTNTNTRSTTNRTQGGGNMGGPPPGGF
ncbi:MAG: efflux RND transporter periplasmic adaptor subunit [Syntrophomonadaceae bacterium]|nr:efflux RND transporter periplasmic adaptor subunit [Syntrophomonadaceae bacterium]